VLVAWPVYLDRADLGTCPSALMHFGRSMLPACRSASVRSWRVKAGRRGCWGGDPRSPESLSRGEWPDLPTRRDARLTTTSPRDGASFGLRCADRFSLGMAPFSHLGLMRTRSSWSLSGAVQFRWRGPHRSRVDWDSNFPIVAERTRRGSWGWLVGGLRLPRQSQVAVSWWLEKLTQGCMRHVYSKSSTSPDGSGR